MQKTILICAGGTGGHIFPALSIAKQLENKYTIMWLGSHFGMEHNLVKNYPIFSVSAVGLRGKSLKKLLIAPFKIFGAIFTTIKIIKTNKVNFIVVMGGFVGGIGGIAAILTRTKFILHEQNSVAGTSNKYLHKFSLKSFQAFDCALKNATTCGNPINWHRKIKNQDKQIIKTKQNLNILVLGGSLGAKAINNLVPQLQTKANIWHQTGKNNFKQVQKLYQSSPNLKNVKIQAFIDNMAEAYFWADIVIARSGAMTISELIYTNSPSILVPFPYAIDNHQTSNAQILSIKNCAFLVNETELTPQKIDIIIANLDSNKLTQMQENFNLLPQSNPNLIVDFIQQNI